MSEPIQGRWSGVFVSILLGGCILPVSTGTPLPATTVGKGHLGASVSGEAPVLDLLAEGQSYADLRGAAPAAAMTMAVAYGLGENTDIELAGEGALYFFIFPLPTGASIGLRQHLAATDLFDIAIAGKIGGVTSGGSTQNSDGTINESSASASYTAVQGVIQLKEGWLRPMAAINLMPFRIQRTPVNDPAYKFLGFASAATVGIMLVGSRVQIGPYATFTHFQSDRFAPGWFPSFGLMFAIRPDRNGARREPAMASTPYYAPPPPYPAPAPAPPPPPPTTLGPPGDTAAPPPPAPPPS